MSSDFPAFVDRVVLTQDHPSEKRGKAGRDQHSNNSKQKSKQKASAQTLTTSKIINKTAQDRDLVLVPLYYHPTPRTMHMHQAPIRNTSVTTHSPSKLPRTSPFYPHSDQSAYPGRTAAVTSPAFADQVFTPSSSHMNYFLGSLRSVWPAPLATLGPGNERGVPAFARRGELVARKS